MLIADSFNASCYSFLGVVQWGGNCNPSPDDPGTLGAATRDVLEITWAGVYSGVSAYAPDATGTSLEDGSTCNNGFSCWMDNVVQPSLDAGDAPDFTIYWWSLFAANKGYSVSDNIEHLDDIDNADTASQVVLEILGSLDSDITSSGGGSSCAGSDGSEITV